MKSGVFEVEFLPEGSTQKYQFKFKHQLTLIKSTNFYESYYRKREFRKDHGA